MKSVQGVTIKESLSADQSASITGYTFEDCFFDNCTLLSEGDASMRRRISECQLLGCKQRACSLTNAAIHDVLIDGIGRAGRMPLFLSAVVLEHVILRGRIAMFKMGPTPSLSPSEEELKRWHQASADFYSQVDWALDISEAQFTSGPDLHFIPGHLVRRDPETQALVHRSALSEINLSGSPIDDTGLSVALQWFLEDSPFDTAALVVPTHATYAAQELQALQWLRREGLADAE